MRREEPTFQVEASKEPVELELENLDRPPSWFERPSSIFQILLFVVFGYFSFLLSSMADSNIVILIGLIFACATIMLHVVCCRVAFRSGRALIVEWGHALAREDTSAAVRLSHNLSKLNAWTAGTGILALAAMVFTPPLAIVPIYGFVWFGAKRLGAHHAVGRLREVEARSLTGGSLSSRMSSDVSARMLQGKVAEVAQKVQRASEQVQATQIVTASDYRLPVLDLKAGQLNVGEIAIPQPALIECKLLERKKTGIAATVVNAAGLTLGPVGFAVRDATRSSKFDSYIEFALRLTVRDIENPFMVLPLTRRPIPAADPACQQIRSAVEKLEVQLRLIRDYPQGDSPGASHR